MILPKCHYGPCNTGQDTTIYYTIMSCTRILTSQLRLENTKRLAKHSIDFITYI